MNALLLELELELELEEQNGVNFILLPILTFNLNVLGMHENRLLDSI